MRPRVLVLMPLLGALLGSLASALAIRPQPPRAEPAICRINLRWGSGCLPGPCDVPHGLPVELWVGIASGLLLGLLVAAVFGLRRDRSCDPLAKGKSQQAVRVGEPVRDGAAEQRVVLAQVGDGPGPAPWPHLPGATPFPHHPSVCEPGDGRSIGTLLRCRLRADPPLVSRSQPLGQVAVTDPEVPFKVAWRVSS